MFLLVYVVRSSCGGTLPAWLVTPGHTVCGDTYVAECTVCAKGTASRQPPARLLLPFPIPCCPCSNIALDFVTGLPTLA